MKKDFSYTGKAYKKMLEANVARTEESADKNSNWAPGALRRLKAKKKKEETTSKVDKDSTALFNLHKMTQNKKSDDFDYGQE
jgi:hypothetical protein